MQNTLARSQLDRYVLFSIQSLSINAESRVVINALYNVIKYCIFNS